MDGVKYVIVFILKLLLKRSFDSFYNRVYLHATLVLLAVQIKKEGSTGEFARTFRLKIRFLHILIFICTVIFILNVNNSKYLFKLSIFCSHHLRNNVGSTVELRSKI